MENLADVLHMIAGLKDVNSLLVVQTVVQMRLKDLNTSHPVTSTAAATAAPAAPTPVAAPAPVATAARQPTDAEMHDARVKINAFLKGETPFISLQQHVFNCLKRDEKKKIIAKQQANRAAAASAAPAAAAPAAAAPVAAPWPAAERMLVASHDYKTGAVHYE